ncbi:winged helix-turn-helix domain-containing protein [Sphingomonas sp. BIUV-7]|uniref:Winged helix-turn-helix domain-containing protein n=1 Tax=Sphingomonas natans TaxID=3063330 RepID=A0ABT8YE96_9SPHN|nr:winged helix-turn-helix domain-containing protein [Sphingomonas sp. BIUV-7]MDO6415979.1 winged helix-turn-helix domain-containing protein [Sphingomonas sp. BIUV-7]
MRPALRQLAREDGTDEILEPRVMQVLVALAEAEGAIVSRDDLSHCCWEGRIVGDDAINRVISRLRRSAEGIGARSFRIETITKVGYRLRVAGQRDPKAASVPPRRAQGALPDRRGVIAGGALIAAAAGLGGWAVIRHRAGPSTVTLPPQVAGFMAQGMASLRQADPEGNVQAIGFFRQAVTMAPDYADGWGALAYVYANAARGRAAEHSGEMAQRCREAADRALSIDPKNGNARAARVVVMPRIGNWAERERMLRAAMPDNPDNGLLRVALAGLLASVGRYRETANLLDREASLQLPTPALVYTHAQALWAAGRLEEADRVLVRGAELFPTHFAVWFTRFYILLFTGRIDEALVLGRNRDGWPNGIPESNFRQVIAVAEAVHSGEPVAIDRALAMNIEAAHSGAGFAENMIQFAAFTQRLDDAFRVANGYYFGRDFDVADVRFTAQQGAYTRLGDRRTYILFLPSTAPMRSDPRFSRLVAELGLERYWQEAGVLPDYRRA